MDRYTTDELESMPTLSQGQADDLKVEDEWERVWLSRTGIADGEAFDNVVTHELRDERGRWYSALIYDGDDIGRTYLDATASAS